MKFTIATACKNDLPNLQKTYNSLLGQHLKDFEWLVIDGASTDATKEWLSNLRAPIVFRFLSKPDQGLYDAQNKAIASSRGDYLLFLNAGDCLYSAETLLEVADAIGQSQPEPILVYGDNVDMDDKGRLFYHRAKQVTSLPYGIFACSQTMFFKKEALTSLRFDLRYAIAADYAFTYQVLQKHPTKSALKLERPICLWKLGGISRPSSRLCAEEFQIRRQVMKKNIFFCSVLFIYGWANLILRALWPSLTDYFRYGRQKTAKGDYSREGKSGS